MRHWLLIILSMALGAVLSPAQADDSEAIAHSEPAPGNIPSLSYINMSWSDLAINDLVAALYDAQSHGLPSLDDIAFNLTDSTLSPDMRSEIATQSYLRFAGWLRYGLLDQETLQARISSHEESVVLWNHLQQALAANTVRQSLEDLAPPVRDYTSLRVEMMRLLAYQPIWTNIDEGSALRLGDVGERVEQLRTRLAAEGLYVSEWVASSPFELRLETAVRRFQGRVKLDPSGRMDADTLAQLNLSPRHRMNQLRTNMEQRRWRSHDLGRRHIWVNLANFSLEAWEGGVLAREHQVMVGRDYSSTPEFSEEMRYLVLNPWWGLPSGLAWSQFRAIRRNPGLVRQEGFRISDAYGNPVSVYDIDWSQWDGVWPYRMSQAPGPTNPMGEVKFIFPNIHNVYLHDTTHRDEFGRTRRDMSAGCVRVQDPLSLAQWILEDQDGWGRERIDEVVAGNSPTVVWLDDRMPVHIAYWTVVGDEDGDVRYLNDLYGRDGRMIEAFTRVFEAPQSLENPGDGSDMVRLDPVLD